MTFYPVPWERSGKTGYLIKLSSQSVIVANYKLPIFYEAFGDLGMHPGLQYFRRSQNGPWLLYSRKLWEKPVETLSGRGCGRIWHSVCSVLLICAAKLIFQAIRFILC